MSKRISVWFLIGVIIVTAALTFMITLLFGGTLVTASEAGEVVQATDKAVEEEKLTSAQITAKLTSKIRELMAYYDRYYVGELDVDDLVEGVAEGLVAYSGDKYGDYHPKEEYKELTANYSGEVVGIGVSVTYEADLGAIKILGVIDGGTAMEGGLLPNDIIVAVNGEDVAFVGYNQAVQNIRGEVGTTVTLTIARGENYGERFDVTLERRVVVSQSVTYDEIALESRADPIGLIRISEFNNRTPEQFKASVSQGLTNNVHGFIIDLRNNGGGTLDSVISMLDLMLPEGPIVRIQYKDGTETVYKSDVNAVSNRVPLIILVNGNTASAAELFTSTMRDYGRAIIVGENTYGKGTVQSLIRLSDGSGLRISTSMYAPPYSDNFEGVGIAPDVTVSLAAEYKNANLSQLAYENDAQLQAALNLYK